MKVVIVPSGGGKTTYARGHPEAVDIDDWYRTDQGLIGLNKRRKGLAYSDPRMQPIYEAETKIFKKLVPERAPAILLAHHPGQLGIDPAHCVLVLPTPEEMERRRQKFDAHRRDASTTNEKGLRAMKNKFKAVVGDVSAGVKVAPELDPATGKPIIAPTAVTPAAEPPSSSPLEAEPTLAEATRAGAVLAAQARKPMGTRLMGFGRDQKTAGSATPAGPKGTMTTTAPGPETKKVELPAGAKEREELARGVKL